MDVTLDYYVSRDFDGDVYTAQTEMDFRPIPGDLIDIYQDEIWTLDPDLREIFDKVYMEVYSCEIQMMEDKPCLRCIIIPSIKWIKKNIKTNEP